MKICKLDENNAGTEEKKDGKKKNPFNAVMDTLAGIFTPLLTLFNIIPADSDVAVFLNFLGNAPVYFMPIMAAYTAAKKFGSNPFLAMGLAGAMMHPTFTSIVASGESFSLFGLPVMLVTYSSNALPIILSAWMKSNGCYFYCDVQARGYYPAYQLKKYEREGITLTLTEAEKADLKAGTVDFISFSYYMSACAAADPATGQAQTGNMMSGVKNPYLETSEWGWQIDPTGDGRRLKKDSFDWYKKVIASNGDDLT